jgi:hypothetical protein
MLSLDSGQNYKGRRVTIGTFGIGVARVSPLGLGGIPGGLSDFQLAAIQLGQWFLITIRWICSKIRRGSLIAWFIGSSLMMLMMLMLCIALCDTMRMKKGANHLQNANQKRQKL